jgi:hypothetical protein
MIDFGSKSESNRKKIKLESPSKLPQMIIHIGPHKTGSTHIQSKLAHNARKLSLKFNYYLSDNIDVINLISTIYLFIVLAPWTKFRPRFAFKCRVPSRLEHSPGNEIVSS